MLCGIGWLLDQRPSLEPLLHLPTTWDSNQPVATLWQTNSTKHQEKMRSRNWHSTQVVNQLLWHGHDPATHPDFDYRPNSSTLTSTMRSRSRPPAPILLLWQQHAAVRGHLSVFQQHEPESNIYISAEPAFYVGSVCKHNSERTSHVQAKVYNLYAFASYGSVSPRWKTPLWIIRLHCGTGSNHHLPTILQPSTVKKNVPHEWVGVTLPAPNPETNRIPATERVLPRWLLAKACFHMASKENNQRNLQKTKSLAVSQPRALDDLGLLKSWKKRQETDASALPRTTLGWVLAQWCYTRFPAAIQAHPPGKTITTKK